MKKTKIIRLTLDVTNWVASPFLLRWRAAGVEYERWSLEKVVQITADYWRRKEDAKFEQAFAKLV